MALSIAATRLSSRTHLSLLRSVPNCRTTSGVGMIVDTWYPPQMPKHPKRLWTRRSCSRILRPKLEMGLTDTVSSFHFRERERYPPRVDWAYLENWCRSLTASFQDVYIFTVPLYLPKLDPDGKYRIVRTFLLPALQLLTWNTTDARGHWYTTKRRRSNPLCQGRSDIQTLLPCNSPHP